MPRAGLTRDRVVHAGADLADEVGLGEATVSALARRLGVRVASLYSHVDGAADLQEGIACPWTSSPTARPTPSPDGRAATHWSPSPPPTATTLAGTPVGTPPPGSGSTRAVRSSPPGAGTPT